MKTVLNVPVRTGLGIFAAVGDLNQDLQQTKGLQTRHPCRDSYGAGRCGEMGGGRTPGAVALGEVPNIASRIEGLAAPNTMAVSEATYRLIQGYFECQDLGAQALRGWLSPYTLPRPPGQWSQGGVSMWR